MSKRRALIGLVVVISFASLSAGCGSGKKGQRPPNVVLIVMDTVRQDHLSCYGYERDTTPFLRSLCAEAQKYLTAYSTTCWTAPAHASLFTGQFPGTHGVTQRRLVLRDEAVTLAEVLREHGYATTGICENPMLSALRGYDQGFDCYFEPWRSRSEKGENAALEFFRETLHKRKKREPFFIFVNLVEPHSPYTSSGPYRGSFATDKSITVSNNLWREFFLGKKRFSDDELRHLSELYDEEVRYVDHLVGGMAEALKRARVLDDTVLIVTSDHGEHFGEHNMVDHVFSLSEVLTHVPLIVRYPTAFPPGTVEEAPVQLHDVFPTVLRLAGVEAGAYPSQGKDLLNPRDPDRPIFCEYYYPEQALACFFEEDRDNPALDPFRRQIRSVIRGTKKLVRTSDGKHALFDLADDPNESANRISDGEYGDTVASLGRVLDEMVDRYCAEEEAPARLDAELDVETEEALRALGYLEDKR